MDTAFKRRFDWEYVSTEPANDINGNRLNQLNNPNITVSIDDNRVNDFDITWQSFYTSLNNFITDKTNGLGKSEDRQVGQFFIDFDQSLIRDSHSSSASIKNDAQKKINKIIKNKLLLYLWDDVQGNSAYQRTTNLFISEINRYEDLFEKYGESKIFSDIFINDFLIPNTTRYQY